MFLQKPMPVIRFILLLLMGLLLLPGFALAQAPGGIVALESVNDGLRLTLACPAGSALPQASLNGTVLAVTPVRGSAASAPALVIVVEHSAAMEAPGTPLHSRRHDALFLVEALLSLAAPETSVSLVVHDAQPTLLLPLTTDRAAAYAALAELVARPAANAPAAPLPPALRLAADELAAASAPGVVVVLATDGLDALNEGALLTNAQRLLVDLGAGAADPARPLAGYLPYRVALISDLPARNRATIEHFRQLLAAPLHLQLLIPQTRLHTGLPQLAISGCGAPINIVLGVPASSAQPLWMLPVALLVALGLGAGLRRKPWQGLVAVAPVPPASAPVRPPGEQTTARRAEAPVAPLAVCAEVRWGRQRLVYPLEGRQWTIGSDRACAIRAEGEEVRPLHARLSLVGAVFEITALEGSVTLHSPLGQPLAPGVAEPLRPGEVVMIGSLVRLVLLEHGMTP